MKKTYSKITLVVIAIAILFAIGSFLRENWGANQSPGLLETTLAKWALRRARSSESDVKNPLPATPENLEAGRVLYEKQCAFCHGVDGTGQGPTGPQFYPPVPSLVHRTDDNMTDGQMQSVVSKGIRYTAMPSFERVLTPDEIWKVNLWIRHLQAQPQSAPPAGSPQSPPSHP
jgi:mono/diheme cytochrome c family protein